MSKVPNARLYAAADSFFRTYAAQCVSPDEDTLFNFLNALYSLNDRMRKECSADLLESQNFVALKALRNLFHQHTELLHEVRFVRTIGLTFKTDSLVLCLVERALVERAARLPRERNPEAVLTSFLWYGDVANIQPVVFNVAVDVYEKVTELGTRLSSRAYRRFKGIYETEEEEGHPHRVTGAISCRAGDIDAILKAQFQNGVTR